MQDCQIRRKVILPAITIELSAHQESDRIDSSPQFLTESIDEMRLKKLEQLLKGTTALDVARVLSYRPEMFGMPFSMCLEAVMRGPSDWSVGERELFAAFVSRKNQCPF